MASSDLDADTTAKIDALDKRSFTVELRYGIDMALDDLSDVFADHIANGDATDLDVLRVLAKMTDVIESKIGHMARNCDATWQQIGDALGISRQAAHKRFS